MDDLQLSDKTNGRVSDAVSEMEYPDCPLCSASDRDDPVVRLGVHGVVRCRACSMYYLYPRLNEQAMQRFYQDSSYFGGGDSGYSDTSYSDQESALGATFDRLVGNLEKRNMTGGALLEVGCGYGYLLNAANGYFARRVGTEYSPEAATIASKVADRVYPGGVDGLEGNETFNCIIATHVIEHVYDPIQFVGNLVNRLQTGGTLILAAPDMGGLLRKVMGKRWASYKVPEHIHYFDARSLERLMRLGGLNEIRRIPYPHAFPLGLIASKFGIRIPSVLARRNIWVPATTIALSGKI